jgi:predicted SAM-dependent methyltransferase
MQSHRFAFFLRVIFNIWRKKMSRSTSNLTQVIYPRTKFRLPKQVINAIDTLLLSLRKQANKGLHLGAGSTKIPDLINCDLYNADADVKADATNLEMFDDSSIDLIESNHMIEHLSFADTDLALSEWHRVLRNGGLLVLTFPDITSISIQWIKYSLAYPLFPRPNRLDYIVKMLVGSQEHDGMFHKNAFDIQRMSRILSKHGFNIEFTYCRYPKRPTPSRLVIARKVNS